jgi:hypothetical protein
VLDVLEFETRKSPAELQQDDLLKLGRVVLSLMTRAVITTKNTEDAIVLMKQHYSIDLQRVVLALLGGKLSIFVSTRSWTPPWRPRTVCTVSCAMSTKTVACCAYC